MGNKRLRWLILCLAAGPPGCGETEGGEGESQMDGPQGMDGEGGALDGAEGDVAVDMSCMSIPDPGNGSAGDQWLGADANDHGTPGTAFPVGVVTLNPTYEEGATSSTGNYYYVFRTGPSFTSLTVSIFPTGITLDFVHVHDGDGLCFGPEVTPDSTTANGGTWTLVTDHVYLVEIHVATDGGAALF